MGIYKYFKRQTQPEETGCNDIFFAYFCKICQQKILLQVDSHRFIGKETFEESNYKKLISHLEFHELENRLESIGININGS